MLLVVIIYCAVSKMGFLLLLFSRFGWFVMSPSVRSWRLSGLFLSGVEDMLRGAREIELSIRFTDALTLMHFFRFVWNSV